MPMNQKNRYSMRGIFFVILLSCSAFYIAEFAAVRYLSLSPLIIGILLGMFYANAFKNAVPHEWHSGINFSSKKLLRLAIMLYGFRLTFQNISDVGLPAVVADIIVIATTLLVGLAVGRLLKIDGEIALLTSTGSAICGAAAVLGAEPVLNSKPYKTAVAVSTVVIFGTLAMFLFPALYRSGLLELTDKQWGIYTGATVHEVAHVVGAGNAMSDDILTVNIVVKMIRVMFLAPVLLLYALIVSLKARRSGQALTGRIKITVPWFAFGFITVIGINSLGIVPPGAVNVINYIDTFLLTMAMAALGMETRLEKFKEAGVKPFILAFILFVWLLLSGYFLAKYLH
jgi:uncharacterized integral membrane protein (TIGR00698 family)